MVTVKHLDDILVICDSDSWHSGSGEFLVKEDITPAGLGRLREGLHAQEQNRNPVCASVFSVGMIGPSMIKVIAHNLDGC